MRVSLALAAAALLASCSDGPSPHGNCTMTLAGEGADPSLYCLYSASPTLVTASYNGGPEVQLWGLGIDGARDPALDDLAVSALVVFDAGEEPAANTTYACDPASEPTFWEADAWRAAQGGDVTHYMSSPGDFSGGRGSLFLRFTSVASTASPSTPTHGALDATLVATDGSGKTLALHVEF